MTPEDRKRELRADVRKRRDTLDKIAHRQLAESIVTRLSGLAEVQAARVIAVYRAFGSEFPLDGLVCKATTVLPVTLRQGRMEFVKVSDDDLSGCLAKPWKALDEIPEGLTAIPPEAIDAMIVPGLAFEDDGTRLGYGGGYYDRYLGRAGFRGSTIGVGLRVPPGTIPCEEHDRAVTRTVLVDA